MKTCIAVPLLTLALATLTACGEKEAAPADTEAAAMAEAPTVAAFAGDYDWVTKTEPGDSIIGRGMTHQDADGTGYSINLDAPNDTVRFTASIAGDSLIDQSVAYTDPALPPEVGQVTWRMAAPISDGKAVTGIVAISPVAKPDTVLMRLRVEATKR